MVAMTDDVAKHFIFDIIIVFFDCLDYIKAIQSCSFEAFLLLELLLLKYYRRRDLTLHRKLPPFLELAGTVVEIEGMPFIFVGRVQVLLAVAREEAEIMEELHVHFSIVAEVLVAIEVDTALPDEEGSTGGVLHEGEFDRHLQVHPDCSEARALLAVDAFQQEVVLYL